MMEEIMTDPAAADLLARLRELAPAAFSEGQLDWARLAHLLGEALPNGSEPAPERYGLQWAGKKAAFDALRTPATATLRPDKSLSIRWEDTRNIFIEGENLDVLRLLQRAYHGQVAAIYIDPPYNTGSDSFVYADRFAESTESYLQKTGETNASGHRQHSHALRINRRENGRFHSAWLSMMLPRLFLARNLLADDGFLFVSIDDHELANLRLLLDEVMGEENFRNLILVRRYDKNINTQFLDEGLKSFNTGVEYVLIYSRSPTARLHPVFREADETRKTQGYWKGFYNSAERPTMQYELLGVSLSAGQWKWKEEVAREAVANYEEYCARFAATESLEDYWRRTGGTKRFIRRNKDGKGANRGVEHWIAPSDKILRNTLWGDVFASKQPAGMEVLFNNPKNTALIRLLIEMAAGNKKDGLVLDFFAGSGSTAQAVLEYNREHDARLSFVTVQMPEVLAEDTDAYRAGLRTIADITRKRLRDYAALVGDTALDTGFRSFRLADASLRAWRSEAITDAEQLRAQLALFRETAVPAVAAEDFVWEVILRAGLPLHVPVAEMHLTGKRCFSVGGGQLLVVPEAADAALLEALLEARPAQVVFAEAVFREKDSLRLNARIAFEAAGIAFETV